MADVDVAVATIRARLAAITSKRGAGTGGGLAAATSADRPLLRFALGVLTALILAYGVWAFAGTLTGPFGQYLAVDATRYVEHARWWLAGRSPYLPGEVAGTYTFGENTFLHPPISLPLFAAFTVLPLPLFWAIPLVAIGWSVRGAPAWAWPLVALAAAWPRTHGSLIVGNTDMWVAGGAALGARYGWPALLVAIKPSLALFMLTGVLQRSWWFGLPVLALSSIPFGWLWTEWLAVIWNAPAGLDYSLLNAPFPAAVSLAALAAKERTPLAGSE